MKACPAINAIKEEGQMQIVLSYPKKKFIVHNPSVGHTVILFYPIIDENRRCAIFVTYVKSVTCAENKFILQSDIPDESYLYKSAQEHQALFLHTKQ
jgi:hypothetical protein